MRKLNTWLHRIYIQHPTYSVRPAHAKIVHILCHFMTMDKSHWWNIWFAFHFRHVNTTNQSNRVCKRIVSQFIHDNMITCFVWRWMYRYIILRFSWTRVCVVHAIYTSMHVIFKYNADYSAVLFKASAHSFKQFTSRLLKLSFSLSMHIHNPDGRHAWFHLYGTSRPVRSASEAKKIQNENFLPTVGLEPTTLRSQVWCSTNWASRACCMLSI